MEAACLFVLQRAEGAGGSEDKSGGSIRAGVGARVCGRGSEDGFAVVEVDEGGRDGFCFQRSRVVGTAEEWGVGRESRLGAKMAIHDIPVCSGLGIVRVRHHWQAGDMSSGRCSSSGAEAERESGAISVYSARLSPWGTIVRTLPPSRVQANHILGAPPLRLDYRNRNFAIIRLPIPVTLFYPPRSA